MRTLIVYESMFANTRGLAEAVAGGLRRRGTDVTVSEADSIADGLAGTYELLVLAAPTHALALSRPESRADAVARGAGPEHATTGLREWLDSVGHELSPGQAVAVFDTRMGQMRHLPGSAARQMARKLERNGCTVVARTSFYVNGIKGPLTDGEAERAASWGRSLARLLPAKDRAGASGG